MNDARTRAERLALIERLMRRCRDTRSLNAALTIAGVTP